MTVRGWLVALLALIAFGGAARAEEPASLVLAKETVERIRGDAHREKMRIEWPAVGDETPPDGAEVVIVRGFLHYETTRMVFRGGRVEAGRMSTPAPWRYGRERDEALGTAYLDVDAKQFVRAWNAMRRILAASDARLVPLPDEQRLRGKADLRSHESADWIDARPSRDAPSVHRAGCPSRTHDVDEVRRWTGLRDRAVFDLFAELVRSDAAAGRQAPPTAWTAFAAEEIRAAAKVIDGERLARDHPLLDSCLRVLGMAGDSASEADVAAFRAALASLESSERQYPSTYEAASFAATRLRIRHRWDREDVVRRLRAAPGGVWGGKGDTDWLRPAFREKDPAGWAAFLAEEATREGAEPVAAAAAAAALKELPIADALHPLVELLASASPHVRLEAALTLHTIDPANRWSKGAVVKLALDRSVSCDRTSDRTDRWSRNRALDAALDWGGLTRKDVRAHFVTPLEDEPAFLETAVVLLRGTPEDVTSQEIREAWRRLLDSPRPHRVLDALGWLLSMEDLPSRRQMRTALDRLDARIAEVGEKEARVSTDSVARLRRRVLDLGEPNDEK